MLSPLLTNKSKIVQADARSTAAKLLISQTCDRKGGRVAQRLKRSSCLCCDLESEHRRFHEARGTLAIVKRFQIKAVFVAKRVVHALPADIHCTQQIVRRSCSIALSPENGHRPLHGCIAVKFPWPCHGLGYPIWTDLSITSPPATEAFLLNGWCWRPLSSIQSGSVWLSFAGAIQNWLTKDRTEKAIH